MNEELESLAARHLAGQLSAEEKAALAQSLDASAEARRHFVQLVTEQTELAECFRTQPARSAGKVIVMPRQRAWWPLALAASLAVAAGMAWWSGIFASREPTPTAGVNRGIARVAALSAPDGSGAWKVGDVLPSGVVATESGTLELLFHSGTRLVLQGNCRVELAEERACRLLRGRVTASVPEFDSGFTVHAPGIQVVDVGTEFGVESDGSVSELHVLQGSVLATPGSSGRSEYLSERAAVRVLAASAKFEPVPFAPDRFARPSVPPKPDAAGFIHYSFDEPGGLDVLDLGSGLPGGPFPGKIADGGSSTLRVPGRIGSALALNGHGMLVTSDFRGIGGDKARTVAMWVRIPPAEAGTEATQSLAAWGAPGAPGGHWLVGLFQREKGGRMSTEFTGGRIEGETAIGDGQWHHLASVFFGGNAGGPSERIQHYIDGRLDAIALKPRESAGTVIDTRIDGSTSLPLTLGRHPYHRGSTTQALIDEFYLFDRALTPGEIQSLYRDNRLVPAAPAKK